MSESTDEQAADLSAALEGATIMRVRAGSCLRKESEYNGRSIYDESPASLLIEVRLRDGRRFTLDISCSLTLAAADLHDRDLYPLHWAALDPGLQLQALLFTDEERYRRSEGDPLAELEMPLWE